MTWLYIVLAIVAVIILLLHTPVGIRIKYNGEDLNIKATIWFSHWNLYPSDNNKTEKTKTRKKRFKKKDKSEPQKDEKKNYFSKFFKTKDKLKKIKELFSLFADLFGRVGKMLTHLKIKMFRMNIGIAGNDASDAAIKYGLVCSAVYPTAGVMSSYIRLDPDMFNIYCIYDSDESNIDIDIRATIKLMFYSVAATQMAMQLVKYFVRKNTKKVSINKKVKPTKKENNYERKQQQG